MTDTPVEESLFQIIHSYHQYAAREGDVETLSLEELKALLRDNVPRFMESLVVSDQPRGPAPSLGCSATLLRPGISSAIRMSHVITWLLGRQGQPECLPSVPCPRGREKPYFVTELFRAADKDKDNQICFDEFLYVLGRLLRDYHLQYHRQLCAHYCARHSLY
ncbi:protein S100-A15A isoform X2 [Myotis daubentonii]|uniref:protein S100-A15A isoform X2 n=1 Tax=Myotis daubentonii TaxID=98922 RepID=UPI002873B27C|nr:protein S100-A15A isoform X2 [Myotis daubentonii]